MVFPTGVTHEFVAHISFGLSWVGLSCAELSWADGEHPPVPHPGELSAKRLGLRLELTGRTVGKRGFPRGGYSSAHVTQEAQSDLVWEP